MKILPPIDRRKTPLGRHASSRQKYMRRESRALRAAVLARIREGSIEEINTATSQKLRINQKNSEEPQLKLDPSTGVVNRIRAHNSDFVVGDLIGRPKGGTGSGDGSGGSPDGEGEDDFYFEVTQAEFLDYYFEDMALPDMIKKALVSEESFDRNPAGYATSGAPNQLDKKITISKAAIRRRVLLNTRKRKITELTVQRDTLEKRITEIEALHGDATDLRKTLEEIDGLILQKTKNLLKFSFIEKSDLKYRAYEQVPVPIARAAMFCIMDVSGSMSQWHKDMGKRFFSLLYLFLSRNYQKVDVIFIRHTTVAKEVDEQEFFTSQETGGTMVSPALTLMRQIVNDRYPLEEWNLYGCYASDGDNWKDDIPLAHNELINGIMPLVQHFAYVEISEARNSDMWSTMEAIDKGNSRFNASQIRDASDIYPVFRKLFKQKENES